MHCDLHMHSTHSDGTMAPRALVEMAHGLGLGAIALTDHDTTSGVAEALEAGRGLGVRVLPGVEISVDWSGRSVHMLGYCFDADTGELQRGLDVLVDGRNRRNVEMVEKLRALGVDITHDEVVAEAGGKVVGRPHFAKVLVRKGAVADWQEAFDLYLARGAKAYVERDRFSPVDSVRMIREAGGVAVLAHPGLLKLRDGETLEAVVEELAEAGLRGIECHYSFHSTEETALCLEIARRFGLVVTGGSDFHGIANVDIAMGSGRGDLVVPLECADALEAEARS